MYMASIVNQDVVTFIQLISHPQLNKTCLMNEKELVSNCYNKMRQSVNGRLDFQTCSINRFINVFSILTSVCRNNWTFTLKLPEREPESIQMFCMKIINKIIKSQEY